MATLRGESNQLPTRKVTHVRAPNGRVYIATPQLLEKPGMTPIYDDGKDATTMHETVDVAKLIEEKGRPSHVRLPNGRVLVATDALLERGDLEMLWNHEPDPVIVNEPHPVNDIRDVDDDEPVEETIERLDEVISSFNLSKATKQAIQDEGVRLFGVEIDIDQTRKEMVEEFLELQAAADESTDEDQNTDSGQDGADADGDDQAAD